MKTITSCDSGLFFRVFEGTFSGVLSGLCKAKPFNQAWKQAIDCCKEIEDIVCPLPDAPVGEYISRSGKQYVFGSVFPENKAELFVVGFPDDTCLDIETIVKNESALIGHSHCVKLLEGEPATALRQLRPLR